MRSALTANFTQLCSGVSSIQNPANEDQSANTSASLAISEKYRTRLIHSVDNIRSVGKPYWPESFWTSIKDEMRKDGMMPMFIVLFQHGISSS